MKIAIAGYGQEGEVSYKYWAAKGAELTVFDENEPTKPLPNEVRSYIAPDAFSKLQGFDLVIRTASLNPRKIRTDGKVWSATNEFFAKCSAPIIGVTGTKGKGTTCSLIAEMCKAAGRTVHLVGNIGVPALEQLSDINREDLVVFELSSFQLWDLEKSPETAVVLMIEPDHQDIHASMAEYVEAKGNIGKFQTKDNLIVIHPTNKYSAEIAVLSSAQKKHYMTPEGAYIQNGKITINETEICSTEDVGLVGVHNLENICAAVTVVWNYTQDVDAIEKAIVSFKGLPHRLELAREVKGVRYFNDSFSSAPGATIAAVESFTDPEILICGGFDRGLEYTALAESIARHSNVKSVLLIGQTANKIKQELIAAGFKKFQVIESKRLEDCLKRAVTISDPGDVVLLSPGCASFDMFKDFNDRGEQFKQLVKDLL